MNKGYFGQLAPKSEVQQQPPGHTTIVATGSVTEGAVVALLSDGTVQAIQSTTDSIGTEAVFDSGAPTWCGAAYDPISGKIVIVYADGNNSNYGTAIVGTISGGTITFGTAVVFNSGTTTYCRAVCQTTTGKIVVAYNGGGTGYGRVGIISGTSIAFGSSATFDTTASNLGLCYDSLSDQVVVAYKDGSSADRGGSCVGTITGTDTLTWGGTQQFEAGGIGQCDIVYDTNAQKVVAFYSLNSDSDGYAAVGTVSGSTITYGTAVKFQTGTVSETRAIYDSMAKKPVCVYRNTTGSPTGLVAVVGTVSGSTISFGTAIAIDTAAASPEPTIGFDSGAGKVVVSWIDDSTSYLNTCTGTVTGNSIAFDTISTIKSAAVYASSLSSIYHSAEAKTIITYGDGSSSNRGTANYWMSAGSTAGSWFGAADEGGTNAAPVKLTMIGGVNEKQSALTPGAWYYVSSTGALTTTVIEGRKFGRAITTNSILLTGNV